MALLVSVLGGHVPLAVASLGAMGLLLEVLGEIPPDTVALLEGPVQAKLLAPSSCLRRQVANASQPVKPTLMPCCIRQHGCWPSQAHLPRHMI